MRCHRSPLLPAPSNRRFVVWTATVLAGLIANGLLSQPASAKNHSDSDSSKPRTVTLWEVSREGKPPSYLFGTCHIGVTLDQALPREHQKLITESSRFVMEVDPDEIDPAAIQKRLLLPDGQTLGGLMGEEPWAAVAETLKLGAAQEAFERQHPFALLMYVVATMVQGINTGAPPMDFAVREIAIDGDIEESYLETPDEQLDMFLGFPIEEWTKGISELRDPKKLEEMKADLDRVLDLCRTGEVAIFEEHRAKMKGDSAALELDARIFKLRNQAWLPKLEASFAEGPTFVAVGAGHMPGADGLINLLEKRGYTVRQLEGSTGVAPTLAEAKPLENIPRPLLLEQVTMIVANMLCTADGIALQCTEATTSVCRDVAGLVVEQCAERQEIPNEVTPGDTISISTQLGQCAGIDFWTLIPTPTREDSEGCKMALSKAAAPPGTKTPETISRALLLDQLSQALPNFLCSDDSVALQCTEETKSSCWEIVTRLVRECAESQDIPNEVASDAVLSVSSKLGECVGTDFTAQISPPTRPDSEGCREAVSKAGQAPAGS